jgi:hypothetical protein
MSRPWLGAGILAGFAAMTLAYWLRAPTVVLAVPLAPERAAPAGAARTEAGAAGDAVDLARDQEGPPAMRRTSPATKKAHRRAVDPRDAELGRYFDVDSSSER